MFDGRKGGVSLVRPLPSFHDLFDFSSSLIAVETIRTLLFPFEWKLPFVFISVFQLDYLSVLQSPMPFLIGLPRDFLSNETIAAVCRSVLIIDIDDQSVSSLYPLHLQTIPPVNAVPLSFPSRYLRQLRRRWKEVVPTTVPMKHSQTVCVLPAPDL